MKILAINPPVEDFTAYNLWAMPLGLFRIMEHYQKLGNEVTYLDLLDGEYAGSEGAIQPVFRSWGRHSYWKRDIPKPPEIKFVPRKYNRFGATDAKIEQLLKNVDSPDLILISTGMTYWYRPVLQLIDMIKIKFRNVPIEIGGISATLMPEFFKSEGVKVINGKYPVSDGITGTDNPFVNDLKFFPVNLIEGCPNRCAYCSSVIFNPKVKIKNIENQAEFLKNWNKITGLNDVAFYDDALLLNKGSYLIDFLERLPVGKFRFHTPNGLHLKEVDENLCKVLKKHDFPQLRFGFETAFTRFDSKTDIDQLKEKVEMLRSAGFAGEQMGVYLLCGLPGQTVEEVDKTIEIVAKIGARPYLSEFSPVPGTLLYGSHLKESLLDFDTEPLFQNNSVSAWRSPVFNTSAMSELKLKLAKMYSMMPGIN
ncbi:MAG TPA: B12-binding domain-containing radical SAM protein [bacterium]|nr:B12-binding domain-containing radical SAM protein [bacterium]HPS29051.1 B12-binding domain-containing radical SAM protein [bacterium]